MRGTAVEILVWWAVLMGATLVSISSPGPVELLVAGAAAAGAAVTARLMRRAADVRVRGASGALRAVVGLPPAAAQGLAVLVGVLARPRAGAGRGRTRRIRLREGADPGWAGVALGWSADTCVIDLPDDGRAQAVVHTFRPETAPSGPERALARRDGTR
ncbi:hypothetical protein [Streptomyces sp. KS 21]|uniref:hypothetical protein n=1 Tax=Streptomyces sp. KS 21 TaxID=2485150 RepID=UPI0010ECA248|nr:hypothetical protein [Streptomyces sp. KS 21]TDU74176.1 hypothetical protein EDD91_0813 [Streptomyces sp. KS 21]